MTQASADDMFTRRVCLKLDGMEEVGLRRDVACGVDGGRRMDVYYPPGENDRPWPLVIIACGYPKAVDARPTRLTYKDMGWTVSMCQLLALSGMAAIAHTTTSDPAADLRGVIEHIHADAAALRIDPSRVGILAASGNVPTALTAIMKDAPRPATCAAFSYGCLLDLDGATDVADAARQFGFANPGAGRTVADVRQDVPLLITRAGRDQFPAMNASIDRFIGRGIAANMPITFVNHAEGPHAFDLFDDSRASRNAVRQTLHFLQQQLTAHSTGRGDALASLIDPQGVGGIDV